MSLMLIDLSVELKPIYLAITEIPFLEHFVLTFPFTYTPRAPFASSIAGSFSPVWPFFF